MLPGAPERRPYLSILFIIIIIYLFEKFKKSKSFYFFFESKLRITEELSEDKVFFIFHLPLMLSVIVIKLTIGKAKKIITQALISASAIV